MGTITKYFKKQFSVSMLSLDHDDVSDFFVSSWQKNRSAVPLLCLRTIVFLICLGMTTTCLVVMTTMMSFGYFFIYLTDWGLLLITINSGFALAISLTAYLNGPIDNNFNLPWYVKAYWLMYNISIPIAFVITIFYWALLQGGEFLASDGEYTMDKTLDIFIHGVNSITMFILVMASKHPCHILHVYQPLLMGIAYLVFSIVYYFAGGTDIFGNNWIYPVLDWSDPGRTVLMVLATLVLLLIMYLVVAALTLCRDAITKSCRKDTMVYSTTNTDTPP